MGETKNNPLFVTPQPAVVKRPLSCQAHNNILHFIQIWKKKTSQKTQNSPQNIWKYLVEEVVADTFIQVVAQNEKQ